jgi:RNA polymerase sigma-70 factor (ECF subfamily)
MQASKPPLLEPEAFGKLYEHTHIIIFRFIYGLHGGPIEEVEDLTCDTFFRAWRRRTSFSGGEHDALCWLFTIARRLVIDTHRRKQTNLGEAMLRLDEDNLESSLPASSQTPEELGVIHDQFRHLWFVLQGLPQDKRELLVLRYMLGWKVKEIADYLHREENTVSVSIKRILGQVRKQWNGE